MRTDGSTCSDRRGDLVEDIDHRMGVAVRDAAVVFISIPAVRF